METRTLNDIYRCPHCGSIAARGDHHCRGCGDEIEDHERQLMRIRISELAKQNTPALIGLGVFVIIVIVVSIEFIR